MLCTFLKVNINTVISPHNPPICDECQTKLAKFSVETICERGYHDDANDTLKPILKVRIRSFKLGFILL